MTRRSWLRRLFSFAGQAALAGATGVAYAAGFEKSYLTVREVLVRHPHWPSALNGFRIAHLTDLHYQPWTTKKEIDNAVSRTLSLKPDLIVMTGDYISNRYDIIDDLEPVFSRLAAPHGVYACMGNHDFARGGISRVTQGLIRSGIHVLRNQGLLLPQLSSPVYLAGIDDCWHGQPLLSAAMSQCPFQTPAILLVHEPDFADEAAMDRRIVLQCSGHSHGGQVRLPLVGSLHTPRLAKKYIDGLYQVENLRVFVSRGIGCTGLPIRFFCPPEIALLSLYHA